jgi:hypothetical protein
MKTHIERRASAADRLIFFALVASFVGSWFGTCCMEEREVKKKNSSPMVFYELMYNTGKK